MNIRRVFAFPQAAEGLVLRDELAQRAAAQLAFLHRLRERVPSHTLTDQQWAVLLELFVAEHAGRHLSTSALEAPAGAPRTTTLRLLDDLEEQGLIARDRTGPDRRVTLIRPTGAGLALVAGVFEDAEGAPT